MPSNLYPYNTFELLSQIETLLATGELADLELEEGRLSAMLDRARVELEGAFSGPILASGEAETGWSGL